MSTGTIVLIVIAVVLVAACVALYFAGKKLQNKQDETQQMARQGAQAVSILVIDKKKMKIADAGFPQVVLDNTPWYAKRSKVPVVKAKVGPKVVPLMCEPEVFDSIPVKKECKVLLNGMYIIEVKSARGGLAEKPAKKSFGTKIKEKYSKAKAEEEKIQAEKLKERREKRQAAQGK